VSSFFWELVPVGVPCMSGTLSVDEKLSAWALWYQEVVHMHDAIAISHVSVP